MDAIRMSASLNQRLLSFSGRRGEGLERLDLNDHIAGTIDMLRTLAKAAEELHGFTYRLRPPGFASDNLFDSLRQYVEGFGRRTGLTAALNLRSSYSEPSISLQRATLRVVQEALTNVHRHAGATSVRVDLAEEDSLLRVTVEDNGRGMAATGSDQDVFSLGIGIKWMMTRIRQLGGQVSIPSGPQKTSVRMVVPTVHSDGG
jgi:signal transduction histidine kinase